MINLIWDWWMSIVFYKLKITVVCLLQRFIFVSCVFPNTLESTHALLCIFSFPGCCHPVYNVCHHDVCMIVGWGYCVMLIFLCSFLALFLPSIPDQTTTRTFFLEKAYLLMAYFCLVMSINQICFLTFICVICSMYNYPSVMWWGKLQCIFQKCHHNMISIWHKGFLFSFIPVEHILS